MTILDDVTDETSTARIVAGIFEANGFATLGSSVAWGLSIGVEQTSPDDTITVYDTGGAPPDTGELDIRTKTFQVRIRADDYEAGMAKSITASKILIGVLRQNYNTINVANIVLTSDVAFIGRDENERNLFTANYQATIQPAI